MTKPTRAQVIQRRLDVSSIQIDGIDSRDYPDFVDAYAVYALWKTGVALTDPELDELNEECGDLIQELAYLEAVGA